MYIHTIISLIQQNFNNFIVNKLNVIKYQVVSRMTVLTYLNYFWLHARIADLKCTMNLQAVASYFWLINPYFQNKITQNVLKI
jgi:hypothetical protein